MAPPRKPAFAFVPAMALILFAALLVVDARDFSGSPDEGASETTALQADSREAGGGEAAGSSALTPQMENAAATDDASDGGAPPETGPTAAAAAGSRGADAQAAEGGAEAQPADPTGPGEDAPTALSVEEAPQPDESDRQGFGAETTGADGDTPEASEARSPTPDDDGISTLRILQIFAGAAFLASAFYVFVLPRLSGGS